MPPATAITAVPLSRSAGDCAVTALAAICGCSYESVVRATRRRYPRWQLHRGMRFAQVRAIARDFHVRFRWHHQPDLDGVTGLLVLPNHVAVIKAGQVIETDGTLSVWDADLWLEHNQPSTYGVLARM